MYTCTCTCVHMYRYLCIPVYNNTIYLVYTCTGTCVHLYTPCVNLYRYLCIPVYTLCTGLYRYLCTPVYILCTPVVSICTLCTPVYILCIHVQVPVYTCVMYKSSTVAEQNNVQVQVQVLAPPLVVKWNLCAMK